jgi:Skp family chaperone for outer membrane proteins
MKRWSVLVAGNIAALCAVFVSGAAVPTGAAKPIDEQKANDAKPAVEIGHKTAVFNMAAVMRDFGQAKYQVWLLNNKKNDLSKNLLAMRGEYTKIQSELKQNPKDPRADEKNQQLLALARQIEEEDRKISKQLNDDASAIICELYDKMKAVVDDTARQNGFQIVLAYPDAVTPEELQSAYIKELKLKPPAAQPFFVAPEVDISGRVLKTLNEKYPPVDPVTKLPVDVNKLTIPAPAPSGDLIPMGLGGVSPRP